MEDPETSENVGRVTILDVLEVDICLRAILDLVHIADIVRSERVSRRWQRAVLGYLQRCRSVAIDYSDRLRIKINERFHDGLCHRTIIILPKDRKTHFFHILQKFGSSISHFGSYIFDMEVFKIVASNCPHLRHFKFVTAITKPVSSDSERELGKAFAAHNLERICITYGDGMTGEFINFIENDLKSLQFNYCKSLNYSILSQAGCLRNITELRLHYNPYPATKKLLEALILLNEMPKLENLDLSYGVIKNEASVGLTDCFRRLVNLKTLTIDHIGVNDAMLKALAENCKELEVLQIKFSDPITFWGGLVALVMRKPPGLTCFCATKYVSKEQLEHLKKKLYDNGCGKVTFDFVKVRRPMFPLPRVQFGLVTHPEVSHSSDLHELRIYLDEY